MQRFERLVKCSYKRASLLCIALELLLGLAAKVKCPKFNRQSPDLFSWGKGSLPDNGW